MLDSGAVDDAPCDVVMPEALPIRGAFILRGDSHDDERGSMWRIFDAEVLRELEVEFEISQVSSVINTQRGTVRGLHYQAEPFGESKTLWCTAGSIFDVLVDVRSDEPTYGEWCSIELSAGDGVALHIPRGVAHGYQTLEDGSSLTYLISSPYDPASSRSLSWRDPTINIKWPLDVTIVSARDREAPLWPPRS